ncbi:MAG: hypothetical protein CMJ24_04785 [Phycisphaerae bacterium]|nr:hypothetical protein [Phycisphaerae bacterium]|tara:strand:+ start:2661 stop:3524 length:864 start_codon:yes stop_codon:yes gene_type:complete
MAARKNSSRGHFKRFFLRGLAVVLPSALTLWILVKAYQWISQAVAQPINQGIQYCIGQLMVVWPGLAEFGGAVPNESQLQQLRQSEGLAPDATSMDASLIVGYRTETIASWWNDHWYIQIIGLIVAIIAVYIAGRLVGGFVGRMLYRYLERMIKAIPVVEKIYGYVKQIVDFLFNNQDKPITFNRVVAAEYPRRGIWSVGFQTGESMRSISRKSGDSVTVFIPSSPTPFTGYTVTIPKDDIIELPITVEEAIGFAVSGGVLKPPHQIQGSENRIAESDGDGDEDKDH